MENENIKNMTELLTNKFLATIEDDYKKSFISDLVGQTDQTFLQIFQVFLQKYGKFEPLDIEKNLDRMKAPWDPSIPIETLFSQINDAAESAIYAQHPITDKGKVQAGEILILKTGAFIQDYKDWRTHEDANRTWTLFQEYWLDQYNLKNETETSAASMGYSNSAFEDDSYADTVTNFGTAFAANSLAINNLTKTNSTMATNISQLQGQLHDITTKLENLAAAAQVQSAMQAYNPPPTPPQLFNPSQQSIAKNTQHVSTNGYYQQPFQAQQQAPPNQCTPQQQTQYGQ